MRTKCCPEAAIQFLSVSYYSCVAYFFSSNTSCVGCKATNKFPSFKFKKTIPLFHKNEGILQVVIRALSQPVVSIVPPVEGVLLSDHV